MRWTTATGCPPRPPSPTHDAHTRSPATTRAPSQVKSTINTSAQSTHTYSTPHTKHTHRKHTQRHGLASSFRQLSGPACLSTLSPPPFSHFVYHLPILTLFPSCFPPISCESNYTVMQSAAALAAGSLAFAKRDSAYAATLLTHARSATLFPSPPFDLYE